MSMNWTQYLLGKLAEEAIEVAKEALKDQQMGVNSPWKGAPAIHEVRKEMLELLAVADMLEEQPDVSEALGRLHLTPTTDGSLQDDDVYHIKSDKVDRLCYYAMQAYQNGNLVLTEKQYFYVHGHAVRWAAKENLLYQEGAQ